MKPYDESYQRAKRLVTKYRKLLESRYRVQEVTVGAGTARATMGSPLPLGDYLAGENSYPGPDLTFTPPPSNKAVVNLGCFSGGGSSSNTIRVNWPRFQTPQHFSTGSGQQRYNVIQNYPLTIIDNYVSGPELGRVYQQAQGEIAGFDREHTRLATAAVPNPRGFPGDGQPSPGTVPTTQDANIRISHSLLDGANTPFEGTYSSGFVGYSSATSNNYNFIELAQEGMIWTLWPISHEKFTDPPETTAEGVYFNQYRFGTAKASQYQIGQLGYFYNNMNMGCIPLGSDTAAASIRQPFDTPVIEDLDSILLPSISTTHNTPGIQGFNRTLLISTTQILSLLVVKVCEEVARIVNPVAGQSSDSRFIYVGYDGWAVIRTTNSPSGSMAAQTYVTPQSVTGAVHGDNLQVIFPPNFIQTLYYKNDSIRPPPSTENGLIPDYVCLDRLCNVTPFNFNFNPNAGGGPLPLSTTTAPVAPPVD